MEFRDLKAQYKYMKTEIDEAVLSAIDKGTFIGGSAVNKLEEELASYVGAKHCITCGNGTDALQLALMTWGIGNGDAVFVPDFTFFSSGEVVSAVGAIPVFVDITERTFNISVDSLESAIERVIKETDLNPRVIIAVDLFGQPAEFDKIQLIADRYNMLILEDGAQAFGGSISGKKVGTFGDISTTSFFPAKPLGCYGDGGAIFTDSDEWDSLLRSYRVHGKGSDKYDNIRIGMNSRLDTVQAAILSVKLRHFESHELREVNLVADQYTKLLGDIVQCPVLLEEYESSWAQYTILLEDEIKRDIVQNKLRANKIPSMVYYPKGLSKQTAFDGISISYLTTNTDEVTKRCLSLPMGPYIDNGDIETIAEIIAED